MGYKNVCFTCRKTFSVGTNYDNFRTGNCPNCGKPLTFYDQRFRPPKKDDVKGWEVIEFLRDHGFVFQHVHKWEDTNKTIRSGYIARYPNKLSDAKEFVVEYKGQAVKDVK